MGLLNRTFERNKLLHVCCIRLFATLVAQTGWLSSRVCRLSWEQPPETPPRRHQLEEVAPPRPPQEHSHLPTLPPLERRTTEQQPLPR